MNQLDPSWVAAGIAALALLQVAALAQQRNAREDRKSMIVQLEKLNEKIGAQNGRVGRLESWREEIERRQYPRRGTENPRNSY